MNPTLIAGENNRPSHPTIKPRTIFFLAFFIVFMVVFGGCAISNSLETKFYISATRIEVRPKDNDGRLTALEKRNYDPALAQTEIQVIRSEAVMRKVVIQLNMNEAWGKKFNANENLKTWETMTLLSDRVYIRTIPGTTLIQVAVRDENSKDAATLANAIADAYVNYSETNANSPHTEVIDQATPSLAPFKAGTYLSLIFGFCVAIASGAAIGLILAYLVHRENRQSHTHGGHAETDRLDEPPAQKP